jgi:hypothetical protein
MADRPHSSAPSPAPDEKARIAEEHRRQLLQLKDEFIQGAAARELAALVSPDETDAELEQFIRQLRERKARRKQNLDLLKEFFDDPQKLNVRAQGVPSSTTPEEIATRCRELDYQIRLLKALLEMLEGERQMLEAASPADPAATTTQDP